MKNKDVAYKQLINDYSKCSLKDNNTAGISYSISKWLYRAQNYKGIGFF